MIGIDRRDGEFLITTNPASGQRQCRAKRLILATGGTDRPRRLQIEGEHLPHVSHYFRDPHEYFRKRVLIVGGKNSAVEAALRCHHAGAHVLLSYRRGELDARSIKYWLTPEIMSLIQSGRIEGYFGTLPVKITKSQVVLEGVGVQKTNHQTAIAVDFVLLLIGYEADVSLLKLAGVELLGECQAPRYDPQTMETNVPGLYVAGTATGGTQDKYALFIENCHVHVERIVAALTGTAPPQAPLPLDRPES